MNLLFSSDSWAFGFQHYVKGTATNFPYSIPHGFFLIFFGFHQSFCGQMNDTSAEIKTALVIKVVGQLDTIKRPVLK